MIIEAFQMVCYWSLVIIFVIIGVVINEKEK